MAPAPSEAFALQLAYWLNVVLVIAVLVVELVAFVNCATQRADAFAAVGSLSKGAWLALTGGALLFTLLIGFFNILGIVVVAAALIYLLDLRPALRDAVEGPGPW